MRKIITIRLSAMGDVLLTVPAIQGVIQANPDLEITLVTQKIYAPFFNGIPRVRLLFPEFKGRHKGIIGILKLYADLKKEGPFEAVIDLHGVIRTRIIAFLFKKTGTPVFSIDKGRKEKNFLIKSKYIRFLKHATERYLDTFTRAGFRGQIGKAPYLIVNEDSNLKVNIFLDKHGINRSKLKIGLAPFAAYQSKIWGIQNFRDLVTQINEQHNVEFFLFGGGKIEIDQLKDFQLFSPNLHLVAGELELSEELALVKILDFMISMDSSNMHLSALSAIPTVSIWGGTHPAIGFFALGQPTAYHLQTPVSSLRCRPCSVFGNKPCIFPTPRCMEMVKPLDVYDKLIEFNLLKA